MSRCFPFPPPGYEKKARSDHIDLLTKEKHKERKNKKEKKDKEKREGKEKRDEDRSKDKHKEKKDRKEKHKHKKKDKDRDNDKSRALDDRKLEELGNGHNEEKPRDSSRKAEEVKDFKFTDDLGRRIRDEEKGAANRMVENFSGSFQKRIEGMGSASAKEKERSTGNEMVPNLIGTGQRRIDGIGRLVEKDAGKRIEGKEKTKDRETDDKKGDRHRDRDREKKNKGKDKHRDNKEKEKEKEKMREKGEHNHKEHDAQRDGGKRDQIGNLNSKPLAPSKDIVKSAGADGNNKRKAFEMNGFLHENDLRPNKFARSTSSSQLLVENGKTLELCHIATPCSSIRPGATNNMKAETVLDNNEHKINGIADAQPSSVNLRPSVAVETRENGEVSMKPPHPDSKYLNQIYSVPTIEEWHKSDDQEWLFSSDNLRPKPKTQFEADEAPQVWAMALQIESADIFALPYVIPY